jgi:hypothetical protein
MTSIFPSGDCTSMNPPLKYNEKVEHVIASTQYCEGWSHWSSGLVYYQERVHYFINLFIEGVIESRTLVVHRSGMDLPWG